MLLPCCKRERYGLSATDAYKAFVSDGDRYRWSAASYEVGGASEAARQREQPTPSCCVLLAIPRLILELENEIAFSAARPFAFFCSGFLFCVAWCFCGGV